eukprot:scaffold197681_cov30-Tisochrysis_lutea.AAC.1
MGMDERNLRGTSVERAVHLDVHSPPPTPNLNPLSLSLRQEQNTLHLDEKYVFTVFGRRPSTDVFGCI